MLEANKIDKKLWFKLKGHNCSGEHYILGNPHTFPGRIMGYCTEKNKSFFFSLNEVSELSNESAYWIKGFLTGSEPDPPTGDDGHVHFDGSEYNHWLQSTYIFRTTGYWNNAKRQCIGCDKTVLYSRQEDYCEECLK